MGTLFDSLSKRLSDQAANPPIFAPQQGTVASGLRAKTGKAPTKAGGPQASTLGEQAAMGAAGAQVEQAGMASTLAGAKVGQAAEAQATKIDTAQSTLDTQVRTAQATQAAQAQLQGEQTAATEQAATQAIQFGEGQRVEALNHNVSAQLKNMAAERDISTDNIFRDFERSEKELAFRKDAAELEQIGFVMALQDKAYVDEINRIGFERDLLDKVNFREEAQTLVFGANLDNLMDEMGAKTKLNASQREWDLYIASIDLNSAERIAAAANADAAKTAMIGAAGTIAKVGVDAAASGTEKGSFDSDYQNYKDSGGQGNYTQYKKNYDTGSIDTDAGVQTDTVNTGYGGPVA